MMDVRNTAPAATEQSSRWTTEQANAWYAQQPWHRGFNYLPSYAINQIEMWQADSFDLAEIDKDMACASEAGMSTLRVFLHDLLWDQDRHEFTARIHSFLDICARHAIQPMLVLFDSCWDPFPHLGGQRDPLPGVHNSGWVQSPGAAKLRDRASRPGLEAYVKGVVGTFGADSRILIWDLWNEPDNMNDGSYGRDGLDIELSHTEKELHVRDLLPQIFAWAREAAPSQPLTSGVWKWNTAPGMLTPIEAIQLQESDVVSFHNYDDAAELTRRIESLREQNRPLFLTEYMARTRGSTFASSLPVCERYKVAAINWGGFRGRSQTHIAWGQWDRNAFPWSGWDVGTTPWTATGVPVPANDPVADAEWFHDVWHEDRTPYRTDELRLFEPRLRSSPVEVIRRPGQIASAPDIKDPSVVALPDGSYIMYATVGQTATQKWRIGRFAAAHPGGPWQELEPVVLAGIAGPEVCAPAVVYEEKDGAPVWTMYVQTSCFHEDGEIAVATSCDGIHFQNVGASAMTRADLAAEPVVGLYDAAVSRVSWRGDVYEALVFSGYRKVGCGDLYLSLRRMGDSAWGKPRLMLRQEDVPFHNRPGSADFEWGLEGALLVQTAADEFFLIGVCFLDRGLEQRGTRQRVFLAGSSSPEGPFLPMSMPIEPTPSAGGSGENGHPDVVDRGDSFGILYQERAGEGQPWHLRYAEIAKSDLRQQIRQALSRTHAAGNAQEPQPQMLKIG